MEMSDYDKLFNQAALARLEAEHSADPELKALYDLVQLADINNRVAADIYRQAFDELKDVRKAVHDSELKVLAAIRDYFGLPSGYRVLLGGWDCLASPTKYCIYTEDSDYCLICQLPRERQ